MNWKASTGEAFNKEASWNKLHERLHSKSNKRKVIWYWLAAACLFFALFISLFMSHKKENVLVKNNLSTNKMIPRSVQNVPLRLIRIHLQLFLLYQLKIKLPGKSIHEINKINTSNHLNISSVTEIVQNKKEDRYHSAINQ